MKRIIKFYLFILFFSCCISFFICPLWALDKIVAVVNNEIITQKDLNDFLNYIRLQYSRELKGKALEEKLNSTKLDLLQRLIEDRLMLQQAKNEKTSIEPSRVKSKINEIMSRYPKESDFERDLAKQGLVRADLENKIRDQMLTYNIVEEKVRSKIMIRPEEVTSFYDQNKGQFLNPEERDLTVVILQDESQAKALSYQMRLGEKLEDLAGKYEFTFDKLFASKGQNLRSEIEEVVFKLGINEISEPIKIDGQFFIFKLNNVITDRQLSLAQAQGKIRDYLFEKKLQEALAKWLDELKKQSYIKIIEN